MNSYLCVNTEGDTSGSYSTACVGMCVYSVYNQPANNSKEELNIVVFGLHYMKFLFQVMLAFLITFWSCRTLMSSSGSVLFVPNLILVKRKPNIHNLISNWC